MKKIKQFSFTALIVLVLIYGFMACSKSSKGGGSSSYGSNGQASESSGSGNSGSGSGGKGIKITLANLNGGKYEMSGMELYVQIFDNPNDYYLQNPLAYGYTYVDKDNLEVELFVPGQEEKPWTKPGEYYIGFGSMFRCFYTNGKSMTELGIDSEPRSQEDWKKFPKYNLKATGNTIDYGKTVLMFLPYDSTHTGKDD